MHVTSQNGSGRRFFGAGKTTLLARATEFLTARGLRVGLITNDQAANLVDTEVLQQTGQQVKEVAGACFCCAFNKLLYVCDNLINLHHPDVILGEPVGSCTDLSATVLQPLKKLCADRFDLLPYTVLVDPEKLHETMAEISAPDIRAAVAYIYQKQIQEADLVVINKMDRVDAAAMESIVKALGQEAPHAAIGTMSALTGAGVENWIKKLFSPGGKTGQRIVEVDYDTYARGEAALGWLNAAVELSSKNLDVPTDWNTFAKAFLACAQAELSKASGDIAHLKIMLIAAGGRVQANVTGNAAQPLIQGDTLAPSTHATLVINARVRMDPDQLKSAIQTALATAASDSITTNIAELASLSPGTPRPVYRFSEVIES